MGNEIHKIGDRKGNQIWTACEKCGLERWVQFNNTLKIPKSVLCLKCYRKDKTYHLSHRMQE